MFTHVGRIFQIPLPFFHPFVAAGAEAARQVLVTDRHKLLWRSPDPVTDLLDQGLLVMDGNEQDRYRELMQPSLILDVLPSYFDLMYEKVKIFTEEWQNGQEVEMLVECRKITLLIIMETLCSEDAWRDIQQIWKPILKSIEYISPGPWILWRRIPRPGYQKYFTILDDYLFEIIRTRRAGSKKQDLLANLLDEGLTNKQIKEQMRAMLIAGHDTGTELLAWIFTLLGQNPEVYSKLFEELDKSIGQYILKYLDEVFKETLRLYPPINIGNRMVNEKMLIDGESIAPGEMPFYSIFLTLHVPQCWEKPGEFCPDRFTAGKKQTAFSYIPFDGGPLAFIGAAFGQVEARIEITNLIKTFQFDAQNPNRIFPYMGAALEPRPAVMMVVNRRENVSPN
ncbi:MAG: cytochrome P450 [Chloroflexota bacterium]